MRLITFDNEDMGDSVDRHRDLALMEPCPCGCDQRDGVNLGYIQKIFNYKGFSLIAETTDEVYQLEDMMDVLSP